MVSLVLNFWDAALICEVLCWREDNKASRRMFFSNNDHAGCLFMRQIILLSAAQYFHPVCCLHQESLLAEAVKVSVTQSCLTLCDPMDYGLLCPWNSPGRNTGAGCHFLLQGILPTHGPNLGLLHCRQNLYCLSHWGSPCSSRVVINWHVPCSQSTYFFLPSLHPMDSYPFICQVIVNSKLFVWIYSV